MIRLMDLQLVLYRNSSLRVPDPIPEEVQKLENFPELTRNAPNFPELSRNQCNCFIHINFELLVIILKNKDSGLWHIFRINKFISN